VLAHESSTRTHEKTDGAELSEQQIMQRLKQYKGRLQKHMKKREKLEREGRPATARTLAAIENNAKWLKYYRELLRSVKM